MDGTMERLGIIGAMASEITHLTEQMEEKTVTRAAGLRFYDGTLMAARWWWRNAASARCAPLSAPR